MWPLGVMLQSDHANMRNKVFNEKRCISLYILWWKQHSTYKAWEKWDLNEPKHWVYLLDGVGWLFSFMTLSCLSNFLKWELCRVLKNHTKTLKEKLKRIKRGQRAVRGSSWWAPGWVPLWHLFCRIENPKERDGQEMVQERSPVWTRRWDTHGSVIALALLVQIQSRAACFLSGFSFVWHISMYKWALKLCLLTLGSVDRDNEKFHWPCNGTLASCF